MNELRFTILGSGSSAGVPRLGGNWGACDPENIKNRRQRCSLLIERFGENGTTAVLIDTSPDMRNQLLTANIGLLDAVVFTHEHADHVHGLDDLRVIVINKKSMLPVYAAGNTRKELLDRFSYAFETAPGSPYPPILEMNDLPLQLTVTGSGGDISIETFDVPHGAITVRAIKVNNVLYTPDISGLPDNADVVFGGLDMWILDSLRYEPHKTHINVETALEWVEKYKPKEAIFTNLHIDVDYQTLSDTTPDNVRAAFDGMQIVTQI